MRPKILYGVMTAGGAIGLAASFLQMLEKIELLKHPDAVLTCNLNSVFSCTNVLNAWQSSVFGFPNSLMCVVFFTFFMAVGLVGLTGGTAVRSLRLVTQALALFMLAFGLWFLWQSTYRIHALCVYCIFCFAGLLMINATWLRVNAAEWHLSKRVIKNGMDIFAWIVLALAIAFAMTLQFR